MKVQQHAGGEVCTVEDSLQEGQVGYLYLNGKPWKAVKRFGSRDGRRMFVPHDGSSCWLEVKE